MLLTLNLIAFCSLVQWFLPKKNLFKIVAFLKNLRLFGANNTAIRTMYLCLF